MSQIKAIFFDIDGTLVPFGDSCIPAETSRLIADLRSRGIKVFIATGRHVAWIDNLGDTAFDGYVTANGAYCVLGDRKTCVYRRCIPADDIVRLAAYPPAEALSFVVVPANGNIFITADCKALSDARKMLKVPEMPVKPLLSEGTEDIVQLMAFGSEIERNDAKLFDTVLTDCEPTSWNPYFCDIVPHGSDKATGIAAMLAYFGIGVDNAMAFGDGDNDIPMLRFCNIGVALGQSSEAVKAAADYVTTPVDRSGVENALRRFNLI